MGLSGRKVKQRIPNDPRNLSWADNAAKFGQTYLSKLGWDPSQGLGAEGSGRTSAIKVSQKLDMLGIGMQHQRDANGIAWKQNKDFERLLARLNGATEGVEVGGVEGFDKATEAAEDADKGNDDEVVDEGREETEEEKKKRAKEERRAEKKKRKAEDEDGEQGGERKKRKRSKSKADDSASASEETAKDLLNSGAATPSIAAPTAIRPPPLSHRARNIAMKRLASRTPAALSEILGIPSSSLPSTPKPSLPETPKLTDPNDGVSELEAMQKLTKATLSVADYFKEKLLAKSRPASATPTTDVAEQQDEEHPRMGLGSRAGLGSRVGEDPQRLGMGMGGMSKFAAMFSLANEGEGVAEVKVEEQIEVDVEDATTNVKKSDDKEERRKAKEERKREKEARKKRKNKGKVKEDGVEEPDDEGVSTKVSKKEKGKLRVEGSERDSVALDTDPAEKLKSKKKSTKVEEVSLVADADASKEKKRKRDDEGRQEKKSKKKRGEET